MRNYCAGSEWLPGKIFDKIGPISFRMVLKDDRYRHCPQDQLRPRVIDDDLPEMSMDDDGLTLVDIRYINTRFASDLNLGKTNRCETFVSCLFVYI